MATITLRLVKGTPLTNQEVDDNFNNINTDLVAHIGSRGNAHTNATTSEAGFMSAADKQKMDNVSSTEKFQAKLYFIGQM